MKEIESKFIATAEKGEVSAVLLLPEQADCVLVLGHGAGAGMRHANMERIAHSLAGQNIATFRYQFPFMERGGGRDAQKVSLATVQSAVREAARQAPGLPLLAGGHSFGGRMTSHAAAEGLIPEAKGLIFFAFPLHAPGKPGTERAAHLRLISQPMLFLSGTRDTLARADLLQEVVDELGDKARLHWLDTANHSYKILKRSRQNPEDVFEEMARVSREWIDKLIF
ncbi:MAG: alpha/beta fold hydrolase [Bacteroidetes bacterium]|nr:MAG: alpha/beta fold hydrolase [Bacteroidota bacterium]